MGSQVNFFYYFLRQRSELCFQEANFFGKCFLWNLEYIRKKIHITNQIVKVARLCYGFLHVCTLDDEIFEGHDK